MTHDPENGPCSQSEIRDPEPYTIGRPGRMYIEAGGGLPITGARDTVCDAYDFDGWSVRAASVRGLRHRYFGERRQDAYDIALGQAGFIIVGVCDGVGQLPESDVAASLVATEGVQLLKETTDVKTVDWDKFFADLSDKLVAFFPSAPGTAEERIASVRETMATTAVFAIVDMRPRDGYWEFSAAAIGDSSAWTLEQSVEVFGTWRDTLNSAKSSDPEVAENKTKAIPGHSPKPKTRTDSLSTNGALCVMTDGISDPLMDGTGEVGRKLAEAWTSPPSALNFAAQVGFGRQSHVDDRTCVMVWPPSDKG